MRNDDLLISSLTLGCDPEFFLCDSRGVMTTSIEAKIPGSKKEPFPIGDGVSIHPDNVTLEISVPTYEVTLQNLPDLEYEYAEEFNKHRNVVKKWLKENRPKFQIASHPAEYEFTAAQLASPEAKQFGCDPDLNAYEGGAPFPPVDPADCWYKRFAGGHIHIGYDKSKATIPEFALVQLTEALSLHVLWGTISRNYIGNERLFYYGKPGAFRIKPYGFEYRTPSNFWAIGEVPRTTLQRYMCATVLWALNNEQEARRVYQDLDIPHVAHSIRGGMGEPKLQVNCRDTFNGVVWPWVMKFSDTSKKVSKKAQTPEVNPYADKLEVGARQRLRELGADMAAQRVVDQAAPVRANPINDVFDQVPALHGNVLNQIENMVQREAVAQVPMPRVAPMPHPLGLEQRLVIRNGHPVPHWEEIPFDDEFPVNQNAGPFPQF